jgi:hypothetical protein
MENTTENNEGWCEECEENRELILSCDVEACDECWHLVPEDVQREWQRIWRREDRLYRDWLYQL